MTKAGGRFDLVPFPANNLPIIDISGKVSRSGTMLLLHYEVKGEINQILLPAKSPIPSRKDDLWKATCFEFFIAIPYQPEYWEINISPSGDWNAYKIDAYRQVNMREEKAFTQLPFFFKKNDTMLSLDISADLSLILQPEQTVQISITAIIQTKGVSETYWALKHASPQADFHARETFILSL